MSLGLELERPHLVAGLQVRERPLLFALDLLVAALLVGRQEATEGDHGARGGELGVAARLRCRAEAERNRQPARVGHLRGQRSLPDQVVERELVAVQLACEVLRRAEVVAGRANRLVGLLRVLHFARVPARLLRDRIRAVQLNGLPARRDQRRLRQRRRVGAHVGDVAVLVQLLGDAHRRLRAVAQLPARLLLQGRRHERGGRATRIRLLVGRAHCERGAVELGGERADFGLVEPGEVRVLERPVLSEVATLRDPLAVESGEPGLERARVEAPGDVPVAGRDERAALALPLDDEPDGDRLNAAGRQPLHDLLPEDGRDLVAVEAIEDPARLLCVDQALVDGAGLAERALNRVLGDLVEDHPAHGHLRLQDLEQVPGDRLALAVFVRREQQLVGALERPLQLRHLGLLVGIDEVQRLEVVLDRDAHRPVLRSHLLRDVRRTVRKVADMADARLDDVLAPEVARDRPCLRRALHDYELLSRSHGASP